MMALNVSIEFCAVCLTPSRKNFNHCVMPFFVRTRYAADQIQGDEQPSDSAVAV